MPWINHLPPVCWSTFGILVWNDSGYVNLTQWWYFFIIFEYILHISTPHIMVFCFPLPYFPLSTSALFFAKYSCTHIVYRRSLVTFYMEIWYQIIYTYLYLAFKHSEQRKHYDQSIALAFTFITLVCDPQYIIASFWPLCLLALLLRWGDFKAFWTTCNIEILLTAHLTCC